MTPRKRQVCILINQKLRTDNTCISFYLLTQSIEVIECFTSFEGHETKNTFIQETSRVMSVSIKSSLFFWCRNWTKIPAKCQMLFAAIFVETFVYNLLKILRVKRYKIRNKKYQHFVHDDNLFQLTMWHRYYIYQPGH